jgi:hypothetical protein
MNTVNSVLRTKEEEKSTAAAREDLKKEITPEQFERLLAQAKKDKK